MCSHPQMVSNQCENKRNGLANEQQFYQTYNNNNHSIQNKLNNQHPLKNDHQNNKVCMLPPGLLPPPNRLNAIQTLIRNELKKNHLNGKRCDLFYNLYNIIHPIQPKLAANIISVLLHNLNYTQLTILLHNESLLRNQIDAITAKISPNYKSRSNHTKESKINQLLSKSPNITCISTNSSSQSQRPSKPPIPSNYNTNIQLQATKKPNLPPGLTNYINTIQQNNHMHRLQAIKHRLLSATKAMEPQLANTMTCMLLETHQNENDLLYLLSHKNVLTNNINQIKINLKQQIFKKIQVIQPNYAPQLTQILFHQLNDNNCTLLRNKRLLTTKVKELMKIFLQNAKAIKSYKSVTNSNQSMSKIIRNQTKLLINSKPCSNITVKVSTNSNTKHTNHTNITSNSNIPNVQLQKRKRPALPPRNDVDIGAENEIISSEKKYLSIGLPSICSIQIFRIIVNTIIPKQIFELLLEKKCIPKANSACKIFVRCHKSHFHANSTVLYIHFINFSQEEYEFCRDEYFDFRDAENKRITWFNRNIYNRYYADNYNISDANKPRKKTVFDILGNEFGLIKVHKAKEYEPFQANLTYLSRIVSICLRCKINKAAARKRVCTFCINDERNDRIKIQEYYANPQNNARHKMNEDIQRDLVSKLKVELHLIPLIYKSECKHYDAVNDSPCNNKKCSFTHNSEERIFGEKLHIIRSNAIKRLYRAHGQFELNDYYAVKIQLKYRKVIGKYYDIWWKHKHKIEVNEKNLDLIRKYLRDKHIQLHLIPTVYKNWCYYAKNDERDRICSKNSDNICTFIHDARQQIFGDMLWRIKYEALQGEQDLKEEANNGKDIDLIDEDMDANKPDNEQIDLDDKWWKDAIKPYKAANEEAHSADKDLAKQWRIEDANISVKSQQISYYSNAFLQCEDSDDEDADMANTEGTLFKHVLYVQYDDDKSAKVNPMRTYVDFTFKCKYEINFVTINLVEAIKHNLHKCGLVLNFMRECQSIADWLRMNENHIYRRYKSRVYILNLIASFAVIPDKNYPRCVSCYFHLCDGIKHKRLKHDEMELYRRCCENDFAAERSHEFDTRKCELLHGVIIEKLHGENSNPRYKALINKRKTNIDTYLKFIVIGSDHFNKHFRAERNFKDTLVSYPCNTHQFLQIQQKLNLLYKGSAHRENKITRIIFGYGGYKPQCMRYGKDFIHPQQHIDKKQIGELFRQLNESQIAAIYGALNYNFHTVQGPPATGKTNTCAHIAYLWWMLNRNNSRTQVKIHGMAPTNQGTLLLAQKCYGMNAVMEQAPTLHANTICDGFIRAFYDLCRVPTSIRDLLLKFYYLNKNGIGRKKFKVLYFASKTYSNILHIKVLSLKKNGVLRNATYDCESDGMTMTERLCVNLAAIYKLKLLPNYPDMNEREREDWKSKYIVSELKSADMICTTFGNSTHRKCIRELSATEFTHAIGDECNQSALDTFLGIVGYANLRYLCLAGDIKQLSPVTMCDNALTRISIYEHIIRYLCEDGEDEANEYYTRLNKQYRSHPQIYNITTSVFYGDAVDINDNMQYIRAYKQEKKNYCKLFTNNENHIQFHILTNGQKQIDTSRALRRSKYNIVEAQTAVKYLKRFIVELKYSEEEIAVISDYTAQIDCVYAILTRVKLINEDKILLCTTNEIEGSSKPIVIYMCCRSNNTGNIGFLNDVTRVNVATSRAEYGQIIIGDIYTLQYNPIYKQIFDIHQKCNAVVFEASAVHKNKNKKNKKVKTKKVFNLQIVKAYIPLVNISTQHFLQKQKGKKAAPQSDYHICGGCNACIFSKLFCGRIICAPPIFIYFCDECINDYLTKYCANKMLQNEYSQICAMTIINKSDLDCNDSFGIKLEFDLLLGRYLIDFGLIKFSNANGNYKNKALYLKYVEIASQIVNNIARNKDKIPPCFKVLASYKAAENGHGGDIRSERNRNRAIGIIECKRNHLLKQAIMDAKFFRLVYQIKNCKPALQTFYKFNKYNFYRYREFEENQPTLIVIAYLKACGYSTNIANYLHKKVSNLLFEKNVKILSRNYNDDPIRLLDEEINKLSSYLKLDELTATNNVLSTPIGGLLRGAYAVKLMQGAIIDDEMSGYYERRKYQTAIAKEENFGDDLKAAGFDYYSEKELQDLGYKETPDYYLKKPWIVCYGDKDFKYEITWIDFKYFYCSSTQWIIDKLRFQASRYNKVFGPGAFVFSLGFVQIPRLLQLNSKGLLAALPLDKETIAKFIKLQLKKKGYHCQ